jgi:twitching motility two-component system response regulator PilH
VACDVHFFFPEICRVTPTQKKVLVVDDSMSELRLMKQLLEQGGFQAVGISDPTKIEETIETERPSVILLDVVMPGRNGFQACRELKLHDSYGAIPVILVTSKNSASDKYWGEQQGANGYVVKPFTPDELLRAVRKFA